MTLRFVDLFRSSWLLVDTDSALVKQTVPNDWRHDESTSQE